MTPAAAINYLAVVVPTKKHPLPNYTVKSLEGALRGLPSAAQIMVEVDGSLRPVSFARGAWVTGGEDATPGSSAQQYAVVLVTASD
jgi:hypothetical protein